MKTLALLALALSSLALASSTTLKFKTNLSTIDDLRENGKLYLSLEAFSEAIGTTHVRSGTRVTLNLGKRTRFVTTGLQRGNAVYIPALEVTRGLGYSVAEEKGQLVVDYSRAVVCDQFAFQEDAQRFFNAGRDKKPRVGMTRPERDPYNLDRDFDGLACEYLPSREPK
jgi:hypothetical protein